MYSPKDYWIELAENFGTADASGFAPILHPNTPVWFNQVIDHLQFNALRRALAIARVEPGARILDVGCGTGRWVRRYHELGLIPVGLDATIGMLRIARAQQTTAPLVAGLAYDLPFPTGVFDFLSDFTVVQHIPYELQANALGEMVRVLRPGGRLILVELIRGRDSHIFPRQAKEWIRAVESCGATLLKYFGHEYLFPDRIFVRFAQILARRRVNFGSQAHSLSSTVEYSTARSLYWILRRTTVFLSALTEPILTRTCRASMATHAVFVFRKTL